MTTPSTEETGNYFVGEVKATFFTNPDNYYRVIKVAIDETNTLYSEDTIVMTGYFVELQDGTTYQFFGDMVDHPRYGVQFKVERYEQRKATSKEGIARYLASDEFPGIGKVLAKRIVETLGVEALDRIVADPDVLKKVAGLSQNKRTMLVEKLRAGEGSQAVLFKLAEMGFSTAFAAKIYAKYETQAIEIIEENPYTLIQDFQGFGFQKADQLALRLGFDATSLVRIKGAITFCLEDYCYSTGDTYVDVAWLLGEVYDLLMKPLTNEEITADQLSDALSEMAELGDIYLDDKRVALASLYFSELGIANRIKQMLTNRHQPELGKVDLDKEIQKIEATQHLTYGRAQKAAIKEALSSKCYILTGGPGTGKTTVLNAIVQIYAAWHEIDLDNPTADDFPILLAAPTGRAAKRMQELTHLPASTIHRLLGLTGEENENAIDEETKQTIYGSELEGKLLIIDEMSMVDTWLCHQLLANIPSDMQVILVGDQDQLPSVGPGQVLSDLLRTQLIPSRELDEIFRQDDGSTITLLAHEIKEGNVPSDLTQNRRDRSFFQLPTPQVPAFIATVAKRAQDRGYGIKDIQVLAPMYKGEAGIDRINQVLQDTLNPADPTKKRREVTAFERSFRVGDKVLQLKNNAEENVFNGDMGMIVAIFFANETASKSDEIVVQFDDEIEVTYVRADWNQLTLAYCCSIHKSQGSEFPIVILPLVHQHRRMLQRNLLYTAITRTQQSLIMCGEGEAFVSAIQNKSGQRQTQLYDLLLDACATVGLARPTLDEPESTTQKTTTDLVEETAERYRSSAEITRAQEISSASIESSLTALKSKSSIHKNKNETADFSKRNAKIADKKDAAIQTTRVTILTPELVNIGQIDPLIGMEGLTPYDFPADK
ncbi:MAG: ATP-dependent RecD-like DNA helicase [Aerococcus sp.]|nr:ATP-dependent RecD-like DNA helicase [Aerococcus sp.]